MKHETYTGNSAEDCGFGPEAEKRRCTRLSAIGTQWAFD
jgi:hypothetical protein